MMIDADTTTIAHVAAADENRGRVVLWLSSAAPNRIAVEAALRVAQAHQASLESIYVEDQHVLDLAMHEGVQEISLSGQERRSLSAAGCMRQFAYAAREAERRIAAMARVADIQYAARTLRDTPGHALNRACAESGPWNVVAIADPLKARDRDRVLALMQDMTGVTGFVVVTDAARRTHGRLVLVVEDAERLANMLRIADRLAAPTGDSLVVLLATDSAATAAALAATAHDLLAERRDVIVGPVTTYGDPAALAEALRRLQPGFAIGQAGRALVPRDGSWLSLAQGLECPLFLTR